MTANAKASGIKLGLKANWQQFALLVVIIDEVVTRLARALA